MAWVTCTLPSALPANAYSDNSPWNFAVSTSPCVVSDRMVRTIASCAGLSLAGEHAGCECRHVLVQFERFAGVIGVADREDADLHIKPLVAVDDVVAPLAHDEVAAITAKDDVAGTERSDAGSYHGLQTGYAGNALGIQHAALESAAGAPLRDRQQGRGILVRACQNIA